MRKIPFLGLVLFLPFSSQSATSFKQNVYNQEMLKHGKEIYLKRCSGCHGLEGDGKGEAAEFLDPKPRDFTTGVFKFRSTPLDSLPTDQDLMKVLSHGIKGTSMPSFHLIPEISRMSVIQYIKTFSDAWSKPENHKGIIQGAPFPRADFQNHEKFITRAKKGRAIFIEHCLTCHGRTGIGDGEGGEDLEDDWEQKILPADLTRTHIKMGASVNEIYRTIIAGVAGTPMPSFKETISDADIWDLSAFVLYLRGNAHGTYGNDSPIPEITEEEADE